MCILFSCLPSESPYVLKAEWVCLGYIVNSAERVTSNSHGIPSLEPQGSWPSWSAGEMGPGMGLWDQSRGRPEGTWALPTSPLVECASVGLSLPGGSGFTWDLHKLLEKYDDQWGQRGKSSVFPFVQHLLPLGHCGVTEICMAGPCSPGIYVLAGQGWQETSHEGAKNPEEGSWGCGQGEPYRGGVTAPGIEDLAAFEDVRVGGEMFKVERKHQKKNGVRKRQGVVTSSE